MLVLFKHDFELAVGQTTPPNGATMCLGLEVPERDGHAHFPSKKQKWKIRIITCIPHHQSIDDGRLGGHKKFQPNWSKNV